MCGSKVTIKLIVQFIFLLYVRQGCLNKVLNNHIIILLELHC